MMWRSTCLVLLAAAASALAADTPAVRKRRPPAHEYGTVTIANHSEAARLPPVAFAHWLHRARYTCRVCHVDIGFGMKAGATDVRAADNMARQYCGACHDGRTAFESCGKAQPGESRPACLRCHSVGKGVRPQVDFATFTRNLPRERFGNGVDWEKAEADKLIRPADHVEGVSIKRTALSAQKDFALTAKLEGMPNIVFSHVKHTVWNGCELCHPQMFAVRRGGTKVSMVQIFEGQSCGVCHATVAFPLIDCQRCHTAPVQ
jgi:c(7)-type cytochrome triheme protein